MDFASWLGFFWAELGGEGQDGFAALLVLIGDVHDKSGTYVGVGDGVEDFERPIRVACNGQVLQSREEAALVAKSRGVVMVRMTRFPVGQNDGFGAELTNHCREA